MEGRDKTRAAYATRIPVETFGGLGFACVIWSCFSKFQITVTGRVSQLRVRRPRKHQQQGPERGRGSGSIAVSGDLGNNGMQMLRGVLGVFYCGCGSADPYCRPKFMNWHFLITSPHQSQYSYTHLDSTVTTGLLPHRPLFHRTSYVQSPAETAYMRTPSAVKNRPSLSARVVF